MKPLTDEQRALVEENHNLIYFFLRKHGYSINEFYGPAAEGLCKAAQSYEASKGAFSTWALQAMRFSVSAECRKQSRKIETAAPIISLDAAYSEESAATLGDAIPGEPSDFSGPEIEEFYNSLTEVEKIILCAALNKIPQAQTGARVGMNQPQISRSLKHIREKYDIFIRGKHHHE